MKKVLGILYFVVCVCGSLYVEFYRFSERTTEKDIFFGAMLLLVFVHNTIWIWDGIKLCRRTIELEKQAWAWIRIMILVSWMYRYLGNIYIYFC